jgi:hypothetical protein
MVQGKRAKGKRQHATGNKQQAGKPRKGEWTKGKRQHATGCKQQAGKPRKKGQATSISLYPVPFFLNQDLRDENSNYI